MRLRACLLFLLLVPARPLRAAEPERPWLPLIRSLECAVVIDQLIESWGATGEILRAPGGVDGRPVYRLATKQPGVWIVLESASGSKHAVLRRTTAREATELTWKAGCEPARRRVLPGVDGLPPSGYGDVELAQDLAKHDTLVVFLWSPHMPISVDAYVEIAEACRALSLPLRAVTDPSSDPGYVSRVAESAGIPLDARPPLASIELLFRDLAVHAPTVLVFSRSGVSAPLPGYRNRNAYRMYLEKSTSIQ